MRYYRLGSYIKTDMKVHLIWVLKYRKKEEKLTGRRMRRGRRKIEGDVSCLL
jgi:REP element-mobilizing transposase RayT